MKRRVSVLGPLPPPFGGVSLHIVRFLELLRSQGVTAKAYPYTGIGGAGRLGKAAPAGRMVAAILANPALYRGGVLHVHYGGLGYFLALAPLLAATRARIVLTFHSVRVLQDINRATAVARRLALRLLGRAALFVVVRPEIGTELRGLGLVGPEIVVMPAFLPPAPEEQDVLRLPPEVEREVLAAQAARHLQVCCAAYYLGPGYGHDDIYGVEALLAALAARQRSRHLPLDLWVLVSNRPQNELQAHAEARILAAATALPATKLHLHYELPLVPVMSRCSAFLRPSREDGDSVAVREALALDLPVLASDVVARPDEVRTYANGETGTMAASLDDFLAGLEPGPSDGPRPLMPRDTGRHVAFVRQVLGDAPDALRQRS